MKEEMTPMERVEATLRFEEPDRVPIFLPFFPVEMISPEDLLNLGKDWKKIVEMNDYVIDRYAVCRTSLRKSISRRCWSSQLLRPS
jgi:hypothetical protein